MQRRTLTRFLMATAAMNAGPVVGSASAVGSFECEPTLGELALGCDEGVEEDEALFGADNSLLQTKLHLKPMAVDSNEPPKPSARLEDASQHSLNGTYSFLQRDLEIIHRSGAGAVGAAAPAAPAAAAAATAAPARPSKTSSPVSSRPSGSAPSPDSPGAARATAASEPAAAAERPGGQRQQRAEGSASKPSPPAPAPRHLPNGLRWAEGSSLERPLRLATARLQATFSQASDEAKLRTGGASIEMEMPTWTFCIVPAVLVLALLATACLRTRKEQGKKKMRQHEELQQPKRIDQFTSDPSCWAPRKPGQGWAPLPQQLALQGSVSPHVFAAPGALPQHFMAGPGIGLFSAQMST